MKRKISFSTADDSSIIIGLDGNEITFKIGYCEAGPFNKEEVIDIVDCIKQMLDSIPNS